MDIKKIFLLLLFLILIIGIIAPVNAKLSYCETWADTGKVINGKTKMTWGVASDVGSNTRYYYLPKYVNKQKAEVNKVNKVTVKISGYKTLTFKKPAKGWKLSGITDSSLYKSYSLKGSPLNKTFTMKCYDKKGKLIKQNKGKVEAIPYHQRL